MLSVLRLARPAHFTPARVLVPKRHSSRTHAMQHHRDAVPFTDVAAAGMARTVRALYQTRDEPSIPAPALSGARQHVLLAPGAAAPAPEAAEYLRALAQAAHAAAEAQGTGSVLAGQSSESDEFSDVAVFVAHPEGLAPEASLEPGHVLKELGLSKWGSDLDLTSTDTRSGLPLALHTFNSPETSALEAELHQLASPVAFSVRRGTTEAFFLLGRYDPTSDDAAKRGAVPGWAGLVGVGIFS